MDSIKPVINGGTQSFRVRLPTRLTTTDLVSQLDATVRKQLDQLDQLLGRRIFTEVKHDSFDVEALAAGSQPGPGGRTDIPGNSPRSAAPMGPQVGSDHNSGDHGQREHRVLPDVCKLLTHKLTPRQVDDKAPDGKWAPDSLIHELLEETQGAEKLSLSDYVELNPDLLTLRYSVLHDLEAGVFDVVDDVKAALNGRSAIIDYLITLAVRVVGLKDIKTIRNFVLTHKLGAPAVVAYAKVSAARVIITKERLEVDDLEDDNSEVVKDIENADLPLSAVGFRPALLQLVNNGLNNHPFKPILVDFQTNIGKLPAGIEPILIEYMKASPVPITKANANFFIPNFLSQIQARSLIIEPTTPVSQAEADKDFDVDFYNDDESTRLQISATAVKCAAQLYYSMVLGEELNVFELVNYFTHRYLLRGGIEIQDRKLREDLQLYVFSNRFVDLKTKQIVDRTRPAERQMFYKQVFNQGQAQVAEDSVVNVEFPRLWKLLMLESANYLERARESFNPDAYVSRQNVVQAVEDLQYNLSSHSAGLVQVITPIIYAELNFVIRQILMHKEVLNQVTPTGGTWWRVLETLSVEMRRTRPKATVLYHKAQLGFDVIRSIAEYTPGSLDDNQKLSEFISAVDAYITSQSILQASLTDQLKESDGSPSEYEAAGAKPGSGYAPVENRPSGGAPEGGDAGGEWEF